MCSLSDQKRNYKKMLTTWSECFMESSDIIVLQNCCHSLSFLAIADHTRHDEAVSILHDVLASLRRRLEELAQKRSQLNEKDSQESDDEEDDEDGDGGSGKIDSSISLVIRRIAVLSKRWPLADLIDEGDEDEDEVVDQLCEKIFRMAKHELDIRKPITEGDKIEIPDIWKKSNKSHKPVAETVVAALDVLLSATAWAVRKKAAELEASPAEANIRAKGKANVLVVMQQRLNTLLSLCFEQYLEDSNVVSDEHFEFSQTVQQAAGNAGGDLRSLFTRTLKECVHPVLAEAALMDDNLLIGGYVRFIRQQGKKVCVALVLRYLSECLNSPSGCIYSSVNRNRKTSMTWIRGSPESCFCRYPADYAPTGKRETGVRLEKRCRILQVVDLRPPR